MSIADALKFIKKTAPHALDHEEHLRAMTTGSLAVDIATGIGGFPIGRLSEVFGWEQSGKTTLCVQAVIAAQRRGLATAYLDVERGVDLSHAQRMGYAPNDTDTLYLTPNTFEETVQIVVKLAETGEVPLIIADSVPAMTPKSTFEGDIDETGQIGALARLLSSTLPRLTKLIEHNKVTLVFVNQMRKKVSTGWQPSFTQTRESQEESSGGSALKFYSSLRLDMRCVKKGFLKEQSTDFFTGKEVERPTANLHEAQALKNKVSTPYRRAQFVIRYDEARGLYGIDNIKTVVDIGVSTGIIAKKGSHYSYAGHGVNFVAHGDQPLFDHVNSNPDVFTALQQDVLAVPEIVAALSRQVDKP